MDRLRAPSLLLFAGVSLALHAGIFGVLRGPRSADAPAFEPSSAPLAGETLDVEPAPAAPADDEEPVAVPGTAPQAAGPGPSPASPPRSTARGPSHAASGSPAAATAPPALYGAAGVRYATDLATTFTRAFPQAASADPVWSSVPFGSAGTADVSLTLDEGGHLAASAIGGSPSPALRRGVERTLALLGPRSFTARGALTRLRVVARVSRDDVHDGLHGDVFALSGGSFSGDVGTAFFALPPSAGTGRRIDVELRLLP
ncbi:MAG TPA: hypothetical protein VIF15_15940 [Polyangiaceae bacterium]